MDGEANATALLVGERGPGRGDVLGARVEGVDRSGTRGREHRQAAFAAADIENASAFERDEVGDRPSLDSVFVAPLHQLLLRLVCLQGGAAGAELSRLATGVLEF